MKTERFKITDPKILGAQFKEEIEEMSQRVRNKQSFYLETMCAAFLAMTDIPITEVELVQRFDTERSEYIWFFRRLSEGNE